MKSYKFSSIDRLFNTSIESESQANQAEKERIKKSLLDCLRGFSIKARIIHSYVKPIGVVCIVQINEPRIPLDILKLKPELQIHTGRFIEMEVADEYRNSIYITAKNPERPMISLKGFLNNDDFKNAPSCLNVALGMDMFGRYRYMDIIQEINILITGSTGSGKTTLIDDIILSILFKSTPEQIRFLMIDPKVVELSVYEHLPHLLMPIVTDVNKAFGALAWVEDEINNRIKKFAETGVKSIDQYNNLNDHATMPRIVILIDEFREMIESADKELEQIITNIASKGRNTGIHLILATQLATNNVVTASIKSNIPCRISLTKVDKREGKTLSDSIGNTRLLGSGDLIFSSREDSTAVHAQAPYVSFEEIQQIVKRVNNNNKALMTDGKWCIW